IAGVSSFGMSGTNAHVIVEGVSADTMTDAVATHTPRAFTISARSDAALRQLAAACRETAENAAFDAFCITSNTRRTHFEHRLAIVAESTDELRTKLTSWLSGEPCDGSVRHGRVEPGSAPVIGFVFPGQGAQSAGMGRALWESSAPAFRETIDRCATLIRDELGWSLHDVLWGDATHRLDDTAYAQPALFAVEVALAEQLRAWGITP